MQEVEGYEVVTAHQTESALNETHRQDMDEAASLVTSQQAAIVQIGQLALEEMSLEALLDESCKLVGSVLAADFVSVAELAPDGRTARIVAGTGWPAGVVGELQLGIGDESQAGYALANGGPVVVDDYATEHRFHIVPSLANSGARSGMTVRIGGVDKPFGTLSVFTRRSVRFNPDDANFLRAVANVLGAAIGRIAVERELRASRDQLAAIVDLIDEGVTVRDRQALTFANDKAAQLSGYATADEMVGDSASVGDAYELFSETGEPLTIDDLPGRRAMAGEERPERIIGFRVSSTSEMHWSIVRGVALREPDGEIGHVISIFRDITDEKWTQDTRDYMSDAVAVLSSTLDVAEAAQRLASLSVPRLADYVTVSMVQPDRSIKLVALAHVNPEKIELVRELERILPPTDPDATAGAARVIREGVVESGSVTPEIIDALPLPEDQRALLQRLQLRDYVTVPIKGRTKPIGALSLAMAESGRKLRPREVELALELGARAGVALENARLYQAADARRQELDAVLAALTDAVLVFDDGGKLQMGNQAAQRTFQGNLPDSLAALWQRAGVTSSGAGDEVEANAELDPADDGPMEVDIDRRGRWFELRHLGAAAGARSVDGAAPTVVVLRDITEVRATRAARDAFMGVLSHELRTPITTIYGGSELLSRDLDEERRAEVIADIRAESERLARLVEDLLVMTRVERDMVEVGDEPILLQHLLAAVIRAASSRWQGARITLRAADRLPAVRGDPTYIEQVVRNLLTNAMRYGQGLEQGIDVVAEAHADEVVVRVLDRGNGLGNEEPERLFELFYRSSSARSVPGGAGIGLFVCRNLIEKMGGRVWARERDGGGAEFGFALPVVGND